MKISQQKRTRFVYLGLVLMVLALMVFSFLPLINSIRDEQQQTVSESVVSSASSAQWEKKAQGYQLVLEREPENQNALRGLLEIRLKQSNIAAALEPLTQLAQLNPQQSDYALLLAQTQQYLGDNRAAEATYRTLIAQNPGNILALKGLVDLLVAQQQSAPAIALVQKTLTQGVQAQVDDPNDRSIDIIAVQLLLGEIYLTQNRESEAIAVYDQAITRDSKDFRPVLAKALLLQKQGNAQQAESLFTQAIALAPVQYKDQIKAISVTASSEQKSVISDQ